MSKAYRMAKGLGTSDLVGEVNNMIREGWLPVGGLASTGGYWYQAMFNEKIAFQVQNGLSDDEMKAMAGLPQVPRS